MGELQTGSVQPKTNTSIEDYLELERSTEIKHECFRGDLFAMGGASFADIAIGGLRACV